jgi:hypothetical protein
MENIRNLTPTISILNPAYFRTLPELNGTSIAIPRKECKNITCRLPIQFTTLANLETTLPSIYLTLYSKAHASAGNKRVTEWELKGNQRETKRAKVAAL